MYWLAAKAHAENIFGLNERLAAALFRTAAKVAKVIDRAFAPQAISLYQANGKAAG